MPSLQDYFVLVDNSLRELGIDPNTARGQKEGQWDLKKGSARVWIDMWQNQESGWCYIQIMSPILKLPDPEKPSLYRELLEINDKLYGCGFTLFKEWIYLKTLRECQGLDQSEVVSMLNRIGNYGDQYDDYLRGKYGLPTSGGFTGAGNVSGGPAPQ